MYTTCQDCGHKSYSQDDLHTCTPRCVGCGQYTDPMRLNDDRQCPDCQP